jgi:TPR repeat protein
MSLARSRLGELVPTGKIVAAIVDQDNADAQVNLGWMYKQGRGVEQDNEQAVLWHRKAAEQGYRGVAPVIESDGYEPWKQKVHEQNLTGEYAIGRFLYATGQGAVPDKTQAVGWFQKAAEQRVAYAQVGLGEMYATGRGVARDDVEAVSWFRKAAEQGNGDGQYNLAVMYENGWGVVQDRAEATAWYRKVREGVNRAVDVYGALRRMGADNGRERK